MRHTVVEQWSRGASPLHRLDAGAKIIGLASFLIVLATTHRGLPAIAGAFGLLLLAGMVAAKLPPGGMLARAALVLPFTAIFALFSWAAGDRVRALELVLKAYVSALAVLLLAATTPLPDLLRRLESMGVPGFLLIVMQFLYRYLFLISGEAATMRTAGSARGGLSFRGAAGALAVLFVLSYTRAAQIHRAMLARGFTGHFVALSDGSWSVRDSAAAGILGTLPILVRLGIERFV